MAAKISIQTEVDAAAFDAFKAKFDAFKASLDEMPAAWRAVVAVAEATQKAISESAGAADDQADAISAAAGGVEKLHLASQSTARLWHDMSRSTALVARNIGDMTKSLLAWTGIGGAIGGVAFGGAALGFDELARRMSSERTRALQNGSNVGNMRAADLAFSRFLGGPGSGAVFGGQIASLQRSPQGRAYLQQLLPGVDVENADPYDLEAAVIQAGHRLAAGTPVGQLYQRHPLVDIFSHEQINSLHAGFSDSEYTSAGQFYNQNKQSLNPAKVKGWTDFVQVLDTSEAKIRTVFLDRLSQLEPSLAQLVKDFGDLGTKAINSKAFSDLIDDFDTGAKWLADEVSKPDFQKRVEGFFDEVGRLGEDLVWAGGKVVSLVKWLDPSAFQDGAYDTFKSSAADWGYAGFRSALGLPPDVSGGGNSNEGAAASRPTASASGAPIPGSPASNRSEVENYIRQAAIARGIDPNVAVAVARSEGLNKYVGDYGTSFGPFQLHYGGSGIRGMNSSGLGNTFTKDTGLSARDPSTWKRQVDFALDEAREGGWSPWHGAARIGIHGFDGVNRSVPTYALDGSPRDDDSSSSPLSTLLSGAPLTSNAPTAIKSARLAPKSNEYALPAFATSPMSLHVQTMPGADSALSFASMGSIGGTLQ